MEAFGGLDFRVRVSHKRTWYKRKINLETKEGEDHRPPTKEWDALMTPS